MDERPFAHRGWGRARLRSFADATAGLVHVLRSQANAQLHAVATIVVVGAGLFCQLAVLEWALIVAAIALVWTAEAVNTAIEAAIDLASPERHPLAGKAKDAAAGAVLVAALGAALIGVCVFGPRIVAWTG